MESSLKCNRLVCRTELKDQALVTSCLHIFCLDCANILSTPGSEHLRQCPACRAVLPSFDHAAIVNLRPSDDYKCSILRGLSPTTVIDCANAALSFWDYQMAQEIIYHSYCAKTLMEKYSHSKAELEKVTADANGQIGLLSEKLAAMTVERDGVRLKHDELVGLLKEKNKKLAQVQELYDKLKRKAMLGQLQDAASEAVDSALDRVAVAGATPIADRTRPGLYHRRPEPSYHGVDRGESRAHVALNPDLHRVSPSRDGGPQPWDQSLLRGRGNTPTPTNRAHVNDAASIGLPNMPGLVVGGPPMLDTDRRREPGLANGNLSRGFSNNLGQSGISHTSGLSGSRPGALANADVNVSDSKHKLAQRSRHSLFTTQARDGSHWRPV